MSLFHSLKKTIKNSKDSSVPDAEFQEAKQKFDLYSDTVIKLKGNLQQYLNHVTTLYISSSQIAQDFTTLLEDPDQKSTTTYSPTLATFREEHQSLTQNEIPAVTKSFQVNILQQIDDEIVRNNDITRRCAQRMELFGETQYYQTKMNELREEREKRIAKGKTESASDSEKYNRNQAKFDEVTTNYTTVHAQLMSDISRLWESDRLKNMAPIMLNFIRAEKSVAAAYNDAMKNIPNIPM